MSEPTIKVGKKDFGENFQGFDFYSPFVVNEITNELYISENQKRG